MVHSQLLKRIYLFQYCSPDHAYFIVLPQQSSLVCLYGSKLLHLLGNMGKYTSAARLIGGINSSNIALPGRTILEVYFFLIKNVCIMTKVRIHSEIQPEPSGNPSGSALRNSLVLRLYFTVCPSSRHNTDTVILPSPRLFGDCGNTLQITFFCWGLVYCLTWLG